MFQCSFNAYRNSVGYTNKLTEFIWFLSLNYKKRKSLCLSFTSIPKVPKARGGVGEEIEYVVLVFMVFLEAQ